MKLIFTTIILLCLSAYGHAQTKNTSNESFVRVSFTGLHCNGKNGLCALGSTDKQQSNASLALNDTGTISLVIYRNMLDDSDIEILFGKPFEEKFRTQQISFDVGKEFLMSPKMQRDLNMMSLKNRIVLGSYPIDITNDHYIITFNME